MGFLNKDELPGASPADTYEFKSSDNLDDYLQELEQPKQTFETHIPDPGQFADDPLQDEPQMPSANRVKMGERTAGFVVKNADLLLAYLAAFVAMSDEIDRYKADSDEIAELTEVWGFYFAEKGDFLSPMNMALVTTGFILMRKIKLATDDRKRNKDEQNADKEFKNLMDEKAKLEAKKRNIELRKEVDKLKGDD